jgi:hypothetical protein
VARQLNIRWKQRPRMKSRQLPTSGALRVSTRSRNRTPHRAVRVPDARESPACWNGAGFAARSKACWRSRNLLEPYHSMIERRAFLLSAASYLRSDLLFAENQFPFARTARKAHHATQAA